ncbi:bactofilin family protein [Paenibacillus solanacearum]|nr:polymer-forming cytoskeletal protein [Paenibacillus solanacearum]
MFKKKQTINPNGTDTLIGEGTVFEGKISSAAGVRIEGQLTGDVRSEGDVIVGEQAKVKSHIAARDIVIAGVVHGNVTAKGKLTITSKGQLFGNANAASLIIDEGGVFQGISKMEQAAQTGGSSGTPAAASPELPQQPAAVAQPAAPSFGGNPVVL